MRVDYRAAILPFILLTGSLTLRPDPAYADLVRLTSGDLITGQIISVSEDEIRVRTPTSEILDIDRNVVEQVNTDETRIVDLVSGERVVGQLVAAERNEVIIRSFLLGDRLVAINTIARVSAAIQSDDQDSGTPRGESASLAEIQGRGVGPVAQENPAQAEPPETIGQQPEDLGDIRLIFLRQSTVLLRPGQVEAEAALSYQHTQFVSAISSARFRQFEMPIAIRAGLFAGGEGFLTLPTTYLRRDLGFADSGVSTEEAGIGDVTAGLNFELAEETASRPNLVVTVSVRAPTGSKPNEEGLSSGTGHWSSTGGVQFIKTADPVALFAGISYTHQFTTRYFLGDGVHDVDPGATVGYNFGFGFAVNGDTSLSAHVIASYQSGTRSDGMKIFASSREPAAFRSALTYRYSRAMYIEPSLTIGLNQDTPDFALGLSVAYRFGG